MRLVIECAGYRVEYPLTEGTVTLGRDPSCDIRFPEPSLSRRHLMCTLRGRELVVRDLNTKNGTFIGFQRIEEAHLRPGVRLRAGNCFLFFEEEPSETPRGTPPHPRPPPPPPQPPDLEAAVPAAEGFEEDEEPTPLDEHVLESAAADEPAGTRLIVRDGRWFAQDPATGIEVEIVPVQRAPSDGTQPPQPPMLLAPPGAETAETALPVHVRTTLAAPARPGRLAELWANPTARALLISAGAVLLLLAAAVAWMLWPTPPPEPISRSVYLEQVRAAVRHVEAAYGHRAEGKHELEAESLQTAIAALDNLIREMRQRKQRPPEIVRMIRDAVVADVAVAKDFAKGWDQSENLWDEVAEYSGTPEDIRELARRRCRWLRDESVNMALLNDAKQYLGQAQYALALEESSKIPAASMFGEQARSVARQARDALVKRMLDQADAAEKAQRWDDAIARLREAAQYEPALAEKLRERLARLAKSGADAKLIAQAAGLIKKGQHAQALAALQGVDPAGPYANKAEDLRRQCRMNAAIQSAGNAYKGGQAEEALKILDGVGLKSSGLYRKIAAVLASRQKALEAMRDRNFHLAESNWNAILGAESDANNYYVKEAKRELNLLPERKRQTAQQLADEAREALRSREFEVAQQKFQQALILDPRNASAQEGIRQLEKQAEMDFNMALNEKDPRRALQLLLDARARLPSTHRRYPQIEREIQRVREKLGDEGN